jgi:DNA-directed RNA polymerase subunit E'/Rpb7
MFVLSIIKHTVEIEPNALGRDFIATLVERLNRQFANYASFPDYNI